ncbi:ArsR/SmtB family transcription factor [Gloeobacter violaceus]|uniref:ArsR/SmtB family transcription factor n=1 Tax=Gloeobacter violaceus TaxID=33072 RepID=UPI0002FA45B8|nr:metalloregulator ArsR/SmtB family transcription factor [Gloeobacter violaceus]
MLQQKLIHSDCLSAEQFAAQFHALSEPLRLQVLEVLRAQELCVCELGEKLGVAQSKLSFHLKTLKEAGLVRTRQEKRWVYYSVNLPGLVAVEQYLADYRRFSPLLPARSCDDSPK